LKIGYQNFKTKIMKKIKVLNLDLTSPFQSFKYEIGKKYICDNFGTNKNNECANGFYATDIEGLPYSWNINRKAFEVEVGGKSVIIDQYKQRFEKQTIVREIGKDELISLAKAEEKRLGYLLSEVLFPINPLLLDTPQVTDKEVEQLKQWDSVRQSVWPSVWDSVWPSVRQSVWPSVRQSVWDSVGASVWASVRQSAWPSVWPSVWDSVGASVGESVGQSVGAYISSLFPNIEKWEYIDHEEGVNPFQSGIDLWRKGFIPSFDRRVWRLHAGGGAGIVYTLT
jgi:hypothetical protein